MIKVIVFLLFIIFLLLLLINKKYLTSHFSLYNQLIKDNELKNELKLDDSSVLIGQDEQTYIMYNTKFYFYLTKTYYNNTRLSSGLVYPKYKDIYYLNNGVSCPKQSPNIPCLKKKSENITECVFLSNKNYPIENIEDVHTKNIDNLNTTGLWSFYNSGRNSRNGIIHYGDEISIKNLGSQNGYVCICDSSQMVNGTRCGNIIDIYCYDDFEEINKYGKWIIIPSYAKNNDLYYHYSPSEIFSKCGGIKSITTESVFKKSDNLKNQEVSSVQFGQSCDLYKSDPLMNIKHTNTLYDNEDKSKSPVSTRPSLLTTQASVEEKNTTNEDTFDFYMNHELNDDTYDFDTLKNLEIPIKLTDSFLIINKEKINNKYVYLNICLDNEDLAPGYSVDCGGNYQIGENEIRAKAIGTIPFDTQLNNFKKKDVQIYNWNIKPVKYDINVTDTMFVKGSINLNGFDINTETLKYIKNIPVHFDKEICLKSENNRKTKCINKTHIEILNGSRPINIQSLVPLKPFNLFSKINYTGRQLKIGFNYDKTDNLPFLGDPTEFMNIKDDGKWMSLKIDYDPSIKDKFIAIIYNVTNYGSGGYENEGEDTSGSTMELLKQSAVAEALGDDQGDGELDKVETEKKKNSLYHIVKPPGIKDVSVLGDNWKDGIRSISFTVDKRPEEFKQLKCMETYPFDYVTSEDTVDEKGRNTKKNDSHSENWYSSNYCDNGNDKQQFYFKSYSDKNILTNKNKSNMPNSHLHFHRHGYNESHGKLGDDKS